MNSLNFKERLGDICQLPSFSSTHASFNLPTLQAALEAIGLQQPSIPSKNLEDLSMQNLTSKNICRAIARFAITNLALQTFSSFSLWYNAPVGLGKVVISIVNVVKGGDYAKAQDLFEEGAFQTLVAVQDFAIGTFAWIRTIAALGFAILPDATQIQFARLYKPWKHSIQHEKGADETQAEKDRKPYSYLQGLADAVQCIVLPDGKENRFKAAWAALQGNSKATAASVLV